MKLKDDIILVTGATSGIGRAASLAFAREGATVILLGRNSRKLCQVYDEIVSIDAPTPAIYPLDLQRATADDYHTLLKVLTENFGHLNGVLQNAGSIHGLTPIEHLTIEQWYQTMQVNLNAPFLITQAVLPLLKASNRGTLIFTTCDVGKKPEAYWGAYAVAKSGIICLADLLALELAHHPHIHVHCVDPGPRATALRTKLYVGEKLAMLESPERLMSHYVALMAGHTVAQKSHDKEVVV